MPMIRRLTVDLLQNNRALGVVVEVPYVIRYMLYFKLCNMTRL